MSVKNKKEDAYEFGIYVWIDFLRLVNIVINVLVWTFYMFHICIYFKIYIKISFYKLLNCPKSFVQMCIFTSSFK